MYIHKLKMDRGRVLVELYGALKTAEESKVLKLMD